MSTFLGFGIFITRAALRGTHFLRRLHPHFFHFEYFIKGFLVAEIYAGIIK